jgi:hypothetical protein
MRPHSIGKNLTANTLTTLFTVPTRNMAITHDILMTNRGAGNKHISIYWYDKSTNTSIEVVHERTISAKTSAVIDSNFSFVMDEEDELRAISETGSTMTVVASFDLDARSTVQQFA